ncbi:hypothetical protein [Plantibacter sp. MMLR14_011]|uniref:hypothetical protein n=1 Tax=Plantibacter sp. MMLR14_011 TaxID=1898746 RepID=UPI0008DCDB2E|nr:hypothetical protein [Plantibacter sp. MMLR14_011]OII38774.1 hypothetical protein BIU99_09520 [Plantibacter sp. MMLR14_011]
MSEVLHLGALVPAAVGACCTVGGRRGPLDLVAAIVMLAAMLDLATGAGMLHPLLWAVVLIVLAVASAVRLRSVAGLPAPVDDAVALAVKRHRAAMTVHTSGGLVIMAALMCTMAGHAAGSVYTGSGMHPTGHQNGMGALPAVLIAAGMAVFTALSTRIAVEAARRRERVVVIEVVSMTVSVVAMALAAAL